MCFTADKVITNFLQCKIYSMVNCQMSVAANFRLFHARIRLAGFWACLVRFFFFLLDSSKKQLFEFLIQFQCTVFSQIFGKNGALNPFTPSPLSINLAVKRQAFFPRSPNFFLESL